jgi:hypothetical protein
VAGVDEPYIADGWIAAVQDLQHNGLQASAGDGGGRLSTGQRGYLRCLLHMGHLHSQLAHVNGWAAQAPGIAFSTSVCTSRQIVCCSLYSAALDT